VVGSCLEEERGGMKRAMLELVASCRARPDDVMRYIYCTLLHAINAEACAAAQYSLLPSAAGPCCTCGCQRR
jgi:hypothetical protein